MYTRILFNDPLFAAGKKFEGSPCFSFARLFPRYARRFPFVDGGKNLFALRCINYISRITVCHVVLALSLSLFLSLSLSLSLARSLALFIIYGVVKTKTGQPAVLICSGSARPQFRCNDAGTASIFTNAF